MTADIFFSIFFLKDPHLNAVEDGLMEQNLMVGFSGTLDTGQVEDLQMMKDKLIDGNEL